MSAELFWAKVDKSGDCWLWTGAMDGHGYGHLNRWGNGRSTTYKAHRYALMLEGVDVAGLDVDHICFNRACVRPSHLRTATRKQNHEHKPGARRDSKSGIRGVFYDNTFHKWVGSVGHFGQQHRKSFATSDEAADWVLAKRLELFTHNALDRAES